MNTRQIVFIFIGSILNCVSNAISDDEYDIELCQIDDEDCIFKMATMIMNKHFKGLDNLGLQSLDPFRIDTLSVKQDLNAVKIDARIFDVDMTGISKAKLIKFQGFDKGEIELRFIIPAGRFDGPYKIKGKLLKLNIEGHGIMKITYSNMDVRMVFSLGNKTVDGKTYFHGEKQKMTMSITSGTANLSHLGSIANSFVSWSFVTLVNAVRETYCKPMSQIYMDKINSVFQKVSIDELFAP